MNEPDPIDEAAAMDMQIASRRKIFTALRFWVACPTPACRRHRRCAGDVATCETIFWPVVPEEAKIWWRAVFDAKRVGRTAGQAARAADAALKHLREWRAWSRAKEAKKNAAANKAAAAGAMPLSGPSVHG